VRRRVDAAAAAREPHMVWNAFVDLIATEDYADLSPLQRKAHLVFWYESEVQNGGHGQYFENQGSTACARRSMPCMSSGSRARRECSRGRWRPSRWRTDRRLGDSLLTSLSRSWTPRSAAAGPR